jgi:poly-beta-1,6-N-acetyl-D-glucosamine synthase
VSDIRTFGVTPLQNACAYVLITPTKDEEATIGETIQSVLIQTIKPVEWVIVSDGSSDRTNEIIHAAANAHPWIRAILLPQRNQRNFAAVVRAAEAGAFALREKTYEYIGLLDADVRFEPDYFEKVIQQFQASPKLGLAGGVVHDIGKSKNKTPRNQKDVPGASQFFKRRCFEELGGLIAVPEGGWDGLTCARARMLGYETKLLTNVTMDHLKPRNIAEGGHFRRSWQMGIRDYAIGYHPLFELFKCISKIIESPVMVGGIAWWMGYCCGAIQRRKRIVPGDLLEYIRSEQKKRLQEMLPAHNRHSHTG